MEHYDTIIIGAGPAGCCCAYELEKAGKRVLILEKNPLPQNKVCAGLLIKEADQIIKDLNPPHSIYCQEKILHLKNNIYDQEEKSDVTYTNINRKRLSTWLISRLKETKIYDQTCVKSIRMKENNFIVEHEKDCYSTPILVGADGYHSMVRKFLGYAPASLINTYQLLIDQNSQSDHVTFIFNDFTQFYGWALPKDQKFLIGCGLTEDNISLFENQFKKQIKGKVITRQSFPLTRIESLKEIQFGKKHCFLIGEAAGLVCPLSGEGISFALKSAANAAAVIARGKTIKSYQKLNQPLIQFLKKRLKTIKPFRKFITGVKNAQNSHR